jgi:hypothetical protein
MAKNLADIGKKIGEHLELIGSLTALENASIELPKAYKNPQTHSDEGTLALYKQTRTVEDAYHKTMELFSERSGKKNKYTIEVNGIKETITPEFFDPIKYRLNWSKDALKGLVHIYKDEIKKTIEEIDSFITKYLK